MILLIIKIRKKLFGEIISEFENIGDKIWSGGIPGVEMGRGILNVNLTSGYSGCGKVWCTGSVTVSKLVTSAKID